MGWDYWDTFRLHEAACLIAGEPTIQRRVSKFGEIVDELPAAARPVFKRLWRAVAMGRQYQSGEQEHADHPKEETLTILPIIEGDDDLFVAREELRRWIQAIGGKSAYQFLQPERRVDSQNQAAALPPAPLNATCVDAETEQSDAPSAPTVLWRPKEIGRADDLRRALHNYLLLADKTAPPPKAREVLDVWSTDRPPRITRVHAGSVDYPANGPDGEKTANIGQIQDRVDNLVERLNTA
jgi:hypothetical protein